MRRLLTLLGFRECTVHGFRWMGTGLCPRCYRFRDRWPR